MACDGIQALTGALGARLRGRFAPGTLLTAVLGREIIERQAAQGWGKGIIPKLAADLRAEFPDIKGFSARNLGYMKALAEAWPST